MDEALAYFLTWTCYGTCLPGDERCWTERGKGFQLPNDCFRQVARSLLKEPPLALTTAQRKIVEQTIAEHCSIRNWILHAVNCRTNHVHAVVTANNVEPPEVVRQFKDWCTRRLKPSLRNRKHVWTKSGSGRLIFDFEGLEGAVIYTKDGQ